MHLDHLIAFERIVELGSFSRAAQELGLAQPTVSARIRALEAELGGELFVRGGRGVALSPLGESFLPYARRALQVLEEGRRAVRLAATGRGGRVTVGVIESLTGGFFAAALRRFISAFPQATLSVKAEHSERIVQMVADGVVSLGLITWPTFAADLVPRLRFREPLVMVAPPTHPLAGRGPVSLEQVVRARPAMLLVRWGPQAEPLRERLSALVPTAIEVPIDSARRMVLAGDGIALLTRTLVDDDLAIGHLVEIPVSDLTLPYRESALVILHGHELPAVGEALVMLLREEGTRAAVLR